MLNVTLARLAGREGLPLPAEESDGARPLAAATGPPFPRCGPRSRTCAPAAGSSRSSPTPIATTSRPRSGTSASPSSWRSSPPRSARTSRPTATGTTSSPRRAPTAPGTSTSPRASSTTSRRRPTLGLRTIWINRLGEEPEPHPDVELHTLEGLGAALDSLVAVSVRPFAEADLERSPRSSQRDEERLLGRPSRIGVERRAGLARRDRPRAQLAAPRGGRRDRAVGWVEPHTGGSASRSASSAWTSRAGGSAARSWSGRSRCSPRPARSRIHQVALAADVRAPALFAGRGYREVRRFWEMTIELDGPPPAPVASGGAADRAVRRGRRARLPRRARGGVPGPLGAPHAPVRGVVGASSGRARLRPDALVRRPRRRRARRRRPQRAEPERRRLDRRARRPSPVARPRARQGAAPAQLRRVPPARRRPRRLGVDAESPTGATQLYETVGMHVELEQIVYEKELV